MQIKKLVFSFLCFSYIACAETHSSWVDLNLSPYVGGENLLMIQKGIERMEDYAFASKDNLSLKLPDLNSPPPGYWERYFAQWLIWLPVNCSCCVTQHEIFGHGYRVRDLGDEYATVLGYKMYVLAGATNFEFTSKLTSSQYLSIVVAGIEANDVMTQQMRLKWLNNGFLDPRQFGLYVANALSLTQYTLVEDPPEQNPATSGNDVVSFLHYLKTTYPDTSLDQTKVRNITLVNLLDPFIYFSLASSYQYVQTGRPMKIPMFQIGPVRYLPSARVSMTPFGLEGFSEHFFLVNDSAPTYVYMKWGKNGANTYSGIGARNEALFRNQIGSLGFRMDFWHEPEVLFEQGLLSAEEIMQLPRGAEIPQLYPDAVLRKKKFGGAISLIGAYGKESWPARVLLELGYKSAGYLPGEALRASPIVRGGFSAAF